jgi:hypothetical protein
MNKIELVKDYNQKLKAYRYAPDCLLIGFILGFFLSGHEIIVGLILGLATKTALRYYLYSYLEKTANLIEAYVVAEMKSQGYQLIEEYEQAEKDGIKYSYRVDPESGKYFLGRE